MNCEARTKYNAPRAYVSARVLSAMLPSGPKYLTFQCNVRVGELWPWLTVHPSHLGSCNHGQTIRVPNQVDKGQVLGPVTDVCRLRLRRWHYLFAQVPLDGLLREQAIRERRDLRTWVVLSARITKKRTPRQLPFAISDGKQSTPDPLLRHQDDWQGSTSTVKQLLP